MQRREKGYVALTCLVVVGMLVAAANLRADIDAQTQVGRAAAPSPRPSPHSAVAHGITSSDVGPVEAVRVARGPNHSVEQGPGDLLVPSGPATHMGPASTPAGQGGAHGGGAGGTPEGPPIYTSPSATATQSSPSSSTPPPTSVSPTDTASPTADPTVTPSQSSSPVP